MKQKMIMKMVCELSHEWYLLHIILILGRLEQTDWHELPGQNGLHCDNLVRKKIKKFLQRKNYI